MKPAPDHQRLAPVAPAISAREFARFYADYLPRVKVFLARRGCDVHSLDDLAQETFLRAWNGRNRFSGNARLSTWVLGIARNTAREKSRKRTLALSTDTERWAEECASFGTDSDLMQGVRNAIARLPPKQKAAITLVYLNGLSQTEAAGKSRCAPAAFRRRLAHGRTRLRKMLIDKAND